MTAGNGEICDFFDVFCPREGERRPARMFCSHFCFSPFRLVWCIYLVILFGTSLVARSSLKLAKAEALKSPAASKLVAKMRSHSRHSVEDGSIETGGAAVASAAPSVAAVILPFTRAPLEDRSKYEKLFCDDSEMDSASSDDDSGTERNLSYPHVGNSLECGPSEKTRPGQRESAGAKLTDEDSIGSATDLKDRCDEDDDDEEDTNSPRHRRSEDGPRKRGRRFLFLLIFYRKFTTCFK